MFHALVSLLRRPRLVLVLAVLLLVGAAVAGSGVQSALRVGGTLDPASDSSRVAEQVADAAPGLAPNLVLDVSAASGVDSPAATRAAADLAGVLAADPTVTGVRSYWTDRDPRLRSADGGVGLITARLTGDDTQVAQSYQQLSPRVSEPRNGVSVTAVGSAAVRATTDDTISADLLRAEVIALPITFLVLLVVFGGFWAALLPVGVGVFAILTTNAVLRGIAAVTDVSVFALNLTTALGLGLAIDYALLIVRRYREELTGGRPRADALATTLRTAGRTVAVSGVTVAVALAAMLLFPLYFLRSFAYAGVAVVVLAGVGALVVVPAAITLLGRRLDPSRRARATHSRPVLEGAWARVSLWASRHARVVAPLTVGVLLLVAVPFAGVNPGVADERQLPASSPVRQVQQDVRAEVRAATGPAATVALPPGADPAAVVGQVRAVGGVTGATVVPTPTGALLLVDAGTTPVTDTTDLVDQLRSAVGPSGGLVGGPAAELVDTRAAIARGLPVALTVILAASLILVFLLTGSAVLPLLAVAANALSLTVMLGAIVWVFQDGHLSGLLGFTPTGFIDVSLPLLMVSVAFGLSMDYGVFVLARVVEEHHRGGDHTTVVARALQRTGGVIAAAAVILSVVLVAIGTSQITNTKMLGLGVALAVLVDATVVRCLVMPAALTLLGPRCWWAPAPLRRIHHRIGFTDDDTTPAREQQPSPRPLTPTH